MKSDRGSKRLYHSNFIECPRKNRGGDINPRDSLREIVPREVCVAFKGNMAASSLVWFYSKLAIHTYSNYLISFAGIEIKQKLKAYLDVRQEKCDSGSPKTMASNRAWYHRPWRNMCIGEA